MLVGNKNGYSFLYINSHNIRGSGAQKKFVNYTYYLDINQQVAFMRGLSKDSFIVVLVLGSLTLIDLHG